MVRTRRPRKGSSLSVKEEPSNQAADDVSGSWKRWLMDFDVELNERLHKLDLKVKGEMETLERLLGVMLHKIPPQEAKLPLQQLKREPSLVAENSMNGTLLSAQKGCVGIVTSTACKPHFKSPPATYRPSRSRTRRTRASSESEGQEDTQFSRPRTRSSSQNLHVLKTVTKYQTPANKGNRTVQYVTPKVDPYCPMPLKRYARQGEMAISLEGSPLMMTTSIKEPNICLPVNNGEEVYSIMPSKGPCPSLPLLDEKTKEKLKLLRHNLDQILGEEGN